MFKKTFILPLLLISAVSFAQINELQSTNCVGKTPISQVNLSAAVKLIKKQFLDINQFNKGKEIVSKNCLSVEQIMVLAKIYSTDEEKLEFSKYCYDFCTDPKNYSKVNSIFAFESNADFLTEFVESK